MIIMLFATIILLIPFFAMQFTNEVNWTLLDFVVAGVLLFSTGLLLEFLLRKIKRMKFRIPALFVLFIVFLLIWIELAVGIF